MPLTIDSGDFPALQARALAEIGYAEFDARRRKAAARGLCRGIGLANGVKPTGRGPFESARVRIAPSGQISVYTGALAMGQGIATIPWRSCARRISAWRRRPSRCGPGTPRSSAMAWADSPAARP